MLVRHQTTSPTEEYFLKVAPWEGSSSRRPLETARFESSSHFHVYFHRWIVAGEPVRAADVRAAAEGGSDLRTAATAADADADVSQLF